MFYEIDMLNSQTDALVQAIETISNPENITVEMFLNCSEYFEELDPKYDWGFIKDKYYKEVNRLRKLGVNAEVTASGRKDQSVPTGASVPHSSFILIGL